MINTELFKEVSPLSAKDCFILIERQKSNFNFPIHIHPEYELNYIENAKGAQRIVGDSIEEIEEEELVLVTNPQLEHAWRDYNNKPQNIHEITIQFHSDLLSDQILVGSALDALPHCCGRFPKACPRTVLTRLHVHGSPLHHNLVIMYMRITVRTHCQRFSVHLQHSLFPFCVFR